MMIDITISAFSRLNYALQHFNQSINQSNFYSANILGEAMFSGATAKSVLNRKIEETVP